MPDGAEAPRKTLLPGEVEDLRGVHSRTGCRAGCRGLRPRGAGRAAEAEGTGGGRRRQVPGGLALPGEGLEASRGPG